LYTRGQKKNTLILNIIEQKLNIKDRSKYTFYDLFGGGGAITAETLLRGYKTVYNEIDEVICTAIKIIKEHTAEQIAAQIDYTKPMTGEVALMAKYLQVIQIWSRTQITPEMFQVYNFLLGKSEHSIMLKRIMGQSKYDKMLTVIKANPTNSIYKRLLLIRKIFLAYRLVDEFAPFHNRAIFEYMENSDNLTIYNKSYEYVDITGDPIIYCDIPYINTATSYIDESHNMSFNHEQFYKWVDSQPYPIFISEFTAPSKYECIMETIHKTGKAKGGKPVIERLFYKP
jgi:site-specific DNA-adenine methylase